VTTYSDSDVDVSVQIGNLKLSIPIIGAAMDSVTSSETVLRELHRFGGIGIVNLCGLISRYSFSAYHAILPKLVENPTIKTLQDIYNSAPVDIGILGKNLKTLQELLGDVQFVVSATPQQAERLFDVALQLNIKTFAIQSSFISPYWTSPNATGLNVGKYIQYLHQHDNTVMVGNIASLNAAVPFIEAGVDAIIEGVGSGVQCTTRFVLGIGAGHVATIDALRDYIEKQKSKTKIIADGGISNSGDIVKLLCIGAHAVIIGGMIAKTNAGPFNGFHYGMSAYHSILPRGDLLKFEIEDNVTIERLLMGPSDRADGTLALIPALTNALSNLGCKDINSAYRDTLVTRFPGIKSEGKLKK